MVISPWILPSVIGPIEPVETESEYITKESFVEKEPDVNVRIPFNESIPEEIVTPLMF
jgi:hypothetical protein